MSYIIKIHKVHLNKVQQLYIEKKLLFRFERDLLDRAEEAARSSKDVLVGVALSRDNKIIRHSSSHSDDDEWQSDHVFDSIASDSPRKGKCTHKDVENRVARVLEDKLMQFLSFTSFLFLCYIANTFFYVVCNT